MTHLIILITVSLIWYIHTTEAVNCTIPPESKVRIFETIARYEGNKISFDPLKNDWRGSDVEFSFNTIDKLEKNTFITEASNFIFSLKLSGKQIKEIDDGAFISLTCLHNLLLDHNNISKLTRNVFEDLKALEKLDLSYNLLEVLKDLIFADLPMLKTLVVGNNRIKTVETLAFSNLNKLVYLNLEKNQIKKVSNDIFQPFSNLTVLILSWNNFCEVEPEKWQRLDHLEHLDLAGNKLNRFDVNYNFSFVDLRYLNLSFNSLTVLNVTTLKRHLPKLDLIDLNNNSWFCDDLDRIVAELKNSFIKLANDSTIACEKFVSSPTTSLPKFVTTNSTWVDESELERFVENKIRTNNEELEKKIETLRSFVTFVFVLLCIFVLVEILYRTNICRILCNKLRGENAYVDDADADNFRLLKR